MQATVGQVVKFRGNPAQVIAVLDNAYFIRFASGAQFTVWPDEISAIDGTIRLRSSDDRYELALIGKNLTNQFIVGGVVDAPNTPAVAGKVADGLLVHPFNTARFVASDVLPALARISSRMSA